MDDIQLITAHVTYLCEMVSEVEKYAIGQKQELHPDKTVHLPWVDGKGHAIERIIHGEEEYKERIENASTATGEERYLINAIIGERTTKIYDQKEDKMIDQEQVLIAWINYPNTSNTWEPCENIDPTELEQYKKQSDEPHYIEYDFVESLIEAQTRLKYPKLYGKLIRLKLKSKILGVSLCSYSKGTPFDLIETIRKIEVSVRITVAQITNKYSWINMGDLIMITDLMRTFVMPKADWNLSVMPYEKEFIKQLDQIMMDATKRVMKAGSKLSNITIRYIVGMPHMEVRWKQLSSGLIFKLRNSPNQGYREMMESFIEGRERERTQGPGKAPKMLTHKPYTIGNDMDKTAEMRMLVQELKDIDKEEDKYREYQRHENKEDKEYRKQATQMIQTALFRQRGRTNQLIKTMQDLGYESEYWKPLILVPPGKNKDECEWFYTSLVEKNREAYHVAKSCACNKYVCGGNGAKVKHIFMEKTTQRKTTTN